MNSLLDDDNDDDDGYDDDDDDKIAPPWNHLLSIMLDALYVSSPIFITRLCSWCFYLHFKDEETEGLKTYILEVTN